MSTFGALLENPVVRRETRSRWRGRAFAILLGYAGMLSLAMLWAYASANSSGADYGRPAGDGLGRMARVGHDLFSSLTWIQTLGWMLLAPALTATSIAWERETGLLEATQLSPLPGWKIVAGKSVSALLFIGLLLAASLPVASICFLMGGVSPEEFRAAAMLQAGTALTGAFLGLCVSALCRRANIALTITFVLMLGWFFGSLWAYISSSVPGMGGKSNFVTVLFGHTNPLLAAIELVAPTNAGMRSGYDWPMWKVSLAVQAALWPVLLFLAARATKKPLPEGAWLESRSANSRVGRALTSDVRVAPAPRNAPQASAEVAAPTKAAPVSRWELPLVELIRARNPVLQREARNKFRLRRLPFVVTAPLVFLICFLGYWYVRSMLWVLENSNDRVGAWHMANFLLLIAVCLASGVMGASGFSREREAGTWEGLGLSLLSARDILTAKLRASLLAVVLYSVPLWPLLLLCVSTEPNPDYWRGSVSLKQALGTVLVQASVAHFVIALGLFFSWNCKRTSVAIGWTIATLLLAWAFAPAFLMSSLDYSQQRKWEDLLESLHPFFAMIGFQTGSPSERGDAFLHALFCAGGLYALANTLLFAVWRGLETRRFGVQKT